MGRSPCCSEVGLNRGAWSVQEDLILTQYIKTHGAGDWKYLPKKAGLKRCGKSCRLRWLNYLRPDIKRGNISPAEDELIIKMHRLLGNRWSLIAGRLPGRTDNEIKNYWNSQLSKRTAKSQNLNTNNSSPTVEDDCILQSTSNKTTAYACDSYAQIKEQGDSGEFSFSDIDLHVSLIETKQLEEICPSESHMEVENIFTGEMHADYDQLQLEYLQKSKLQSLRTLLEVEDD